MTKSGGIADKFVKWTNEYYWRRYARRDGRDGVPNWSDAPEWATWATLIIDRVYGADMFRWEYHEVEPVPDGEGGWLIAQGKRSAIGGRTTLKVGIDWRAVKIGRPDSV